MDLTKKQKKYLKKHLRDRPLNKVATDLGLEEKEILEFLKSNWVKEKYEKFLEKNRSTSYSGWFDNHRYTIIIFLTFLVFSVYANSLGNQFVSDDIAGIFHNPNVGNFNQVTTQPLKFINPLVHYLTYQVGGVNPFFYRLGNIAFHLGTVLLVFTIIRSVANSTLALLTAAIFAVHPVLTESITWISGGTHVRYSFFILLSLLAYQLFSVRKKPCFLLLSLLCFLLSLFSSEKAAVYPLLLLLYVLSFEKLSSRWKTLLPFWLTGFPLVIVSLMGIGQRATALETQFYQGISTINPLVQIPVAITSYLELFVWPKGLTLYHSEMSFTPFEFTIRTLISLFFFALVGYSFFKNRLAFFGLSFFLVSLIPTLVPWGLSWVVAERYAYLGTIGLSLLTAIVISKLVENSRLKVLGVAVFSITLLGLSARTIIRNLDWQNQDTLWLAAARTSPSSPQNHNNLGDLYGRRGDLERAAQEFQIAIQLLPGYADAYHNLANTYGQMGKLDLAIAHYQEAIRFNPNLWQSYQNLASIYFQQQDFALAKENLEKALLVNPDNPNLHNHLATVYLVTGDKVKAREVFLRALQIDPNNQVAKEGVIAIGQQ